MSEKSKAAIGIGSNLGALTIGAFCGAAGVLIYLALVRALHWAWACG